MFTPRVAPVWLALLALTSALSSCNIPKAYRGTEFLLPTCGYCPDIAPPAAVTTPANVPVTLTYTVTDTDSPVVTLAAVKAPTKGTLSAFTLATTTGNMTSGYTFTFTGTYTPNTALSGADSFDLQATDNSPTPNVSLVPTVNVTVTPYLTGITVAPANPLVPRGTTKQFSASGAYNDGMNRALPNAYNAITWSSGTPANATINSTGLASLPATGTITGTSAITATSGLISGSATLTVGMPTLVSLAVTPGNVTVPRGTSQQFTATGTFTDNTTGVITTLMTWTSGTATNATITAGGLATAINTGNITGTSLITATDPASGKTGTATLTVGNPNLLSIAVTPGNAVNLAGLTQQFTATGTYSDTQALTLPSIYTAAPTWSSNNIATATINASGLASGVGVGTTSITASIGTVVSPATVLSVNATAVKSIQVTPATRSFPQGMLQNFVAILTQWGGLVVNATNTVTWASSNMAVATVSANGIASGVASGSTSITASSGGVISQAVAVTVTAAPAATFAYVANMSGNDVSAYSIAPTTGVLTQIDADPLTAGIQNYAAGTMPSIITVDLTGKFAYVGNLSTNNVSAYSIASTTGALSAVTGSPFAAGLGAYGATVEPTGRFAYVANRNSNDVSAYSIDPTTGVLTQIDADPVAAGIQNYAAGTQPFSVAVDPTSQFAYVTNFTSNNMTAFTIDPTSGVLKQIDADPLTAGIQNYAAGTGPYIVTVDPTGRFTYVAGGSGVSAFTIAPTTGTLTAVTGSPFAAGTGPTSVAVDPSGKFAYVSNQASNNVSAFTIDPTTGVLTQIDADPVAVGIQNFPAGTLPQSVTVDYSGKYVYVSNSLSNNVSAYSIAPTTGVLTQIDADPLTAGIQNFPTGTGPRTVTVWGGLRQ
ncbi:MAG: beta-propeller fold lactonase family protein [Deltaproteobacteria bacterium]|nr:beta-propeller fold lactonase family protein [Deltaproteobacteria bacterium]